MDFMRREPGPVVEREKLRSLTEQLSGNGPSLEGVPYVWPDLLDDGHPGGFFEKWLNVTGHNKGRRA